MLVDDLPPEPHVNRGGSNRKIKVSREAREALEGRLAMERVNHIRSHNLGNIWIQNQRQTEM